jgi:chromosome segregation ATPase
VDAALAVILAVVAAVGALGAAFLAARGQNKQTRATVESEAQTRADNRLTAAMDGERMSWERTEARLTRDNTALTARLDDLEADMELLTQRLDQASTALAESSGRVVQLTHAMAQAGIPIPAPRTF